jgi:NAD(P)-dependent dehydrogenase (short-subunit alcohol dehydrogenase family)
MQDYTPQPELLSGRIILVTGAGDGIGRAAAKAFASFGANVVLLGRTPRKLESVYDEIEHAGHPQPALYPMDLEGATLRDYEDLAGTLGKEFGHLDGLLHNAALLGALAPLEQYDVPTWYRVLQVNLNAPFLLTRACLPLLYRSEDASVVFTSDSVGRQGKAYWGAYGVSKFAIEGMMQILAAELESRPALRVNSIAPGPVRTRLRTHAYPGENPNALPAPEDVMAPYLYLLGPDSRGVTGRAF